MKIRCVVFAAFCGLAISASLLAGEKPWSAKWIWIAPTSDAPAYNQTILAKKTFRLDALPTEAVLRITADSYYRLSINGRWVNDGPCRAWPEHYQFDVIDAVPYLQPGENEISVVARYFGVGDFHKVPKQPGLLAQLDVVSGGTSNSIGTDATWQVAEARGWLANTPKVSIQMEPAEWYDARLAEPVAWATAKEICAAAAGPWKNLHARDVALMTRQPFAFKTFGGANVVQCRGLDFCLPAVRLMHPGLIEANGNVSGPCGMAAILENEKECTVRVQLDGMKMSIDGQRLAKGEAALKPGKHIVLAFVQTVIGHQKEKSVRFMNPEGYRLVNPLDAKAENPWCFIPLPEFNVVADDLHWLWFAKDNKKVAEPVAAYQAETEKWLKEIRTPDDFFTTLTSRAKLLSTEKMFVKDSFWQFVHRQVVPGAVAAVREPAALMHETPAVTTVSPSDKGDVELMYDLGEQNCGYWTFDLVAPAGVTVDIGGVEYITPEGRIQFPHGNRNCLRYITRDGVNRFTSLKRRSGRFIFLTLRNQTGPVEIRHFGLVESTYPVNAVGSFSCSDARLDKIWEISTRTLKLCMEDTFTDCPLYEQTHWVGDARNESLLAYPVFGAEDIGRRCVRITAQSLGRYPFAGCQTPSCWDVLLPAWSFLWGISAWDYYWYTGDDAFLREAYPDLIKNLKGAAKYVRDDGLFAGPFWNMFDWTPIDQQHHAVLHNSMFMIGAIDSALQVAGVLKETKDVEWLRAERAKLKAGVNRLFNAEKATYPDSVHNDGAVSQSTSQHTAFLSILYNIVEPGNLAAVRRHLTNPPEKMVRIGAPFASLYLYEALEKLGDDDQIVQEIYKNYLPMLESGATTVWESFPSGTTGSGGFPTRSHCHAWSSAPSYFLNRIVLGVKATSPGGKSVRISPRLSGLTWARGTVATTKGAITVAWRLNNDRLEVTYTVPEGVAVEFAPNDSLKDKKIVVNGKDL